MITGTIIGAEAVQQRIEALSQKMVSAIEARMNKAMLKLQAHVIQNKLTGQALHVRTGTLRRSIHAEVITSGSSVTGKVGTNVAYAARHEYGFQGSENVKAHLRLVKQAFGRELKSPVWANVRGFSRQVNYPEHSFLRSAMTDMQGDIMQELQLAVKDVIL